MLLKHKSCVRKVLFYETTVSPTIPQMSKQIVQYILPKA